MQKSGKRRGRRDQVAYAQIRGLSQRAACRLFSVPRSTLDYQARMPAKDQPVIDRMQTMSAQQPRWGYRFIRVLLAREGMHMSNDRCYRIWRKAGLTVPRKRRRRQCGSPTPRPLHPTQPGDVWAMDFVFDGCANGQVLICLTVVEEAGKEALAIDVEGRFRASRVVETLERLVALHGALKHLRCDNGPEFISRAVMDWAANHGNTNAFIDPGKPWQNGVDESFNGKFRMECLDQHWFRNRHEARVVIEQWRCNYNRMRPHSALDYLTPHEFKRIKQPQYESCVP